MVGFDEDPLDVVTRPPPNETPADRTERVRREAEAKRISDAIDEDIRREKAEKKKTGRPVRVLLLGQSESGKSTTLKNFRMRYDRAAWDAELSSWRTVIQLNLVRSTLTILDAVQAEMDGIDASFDGGLDSPSLSVDTGKENGSTGDVNMDAEMQYYDPNLATPSGSPVVSSIPLGGGSSSPLVGSFASNSSSSSQVVPASPLHRSSSRSRSGSGVHKASSSNLRKDALQQSVPLTGQHQLLKLRLAPLRRVEKDLKKSLGAGAEDEVTDVAMSEEYGALGRKTPSNEGSTELGEDGKIGSVAGAGSSRRSKRPKEFTVRRLKDALNGSRRSQDSPSPSSSPAKDPSSEATELIANCKEDMKALWTDENVRKVLKKRRVRLEDSAGFFLDDIDRIATRTYLPSDDDVIRARLRTLGVQEYQIKVDPSNPSGGPVRPGTSKSTSSNLGDLAHSAIGKPIGNEWMLYDVGGSRTIRHAWLPYFENVNAIIFLAPLSCFDERLVEDSRINRLEDSFLLWRTVCSSKLLEKTSLILFMNKIDLLKKKIKAGIKVKGYLPSYGDRPNDVATVVKYLKDKFRDIVKTHAPENGRVAYYYATSAIDTKSTGSTLKAVKDIIFREHLKTTGVL
ncbi:guanine nucleotide binding protein, alpha subunit [Coprinopsis sp. MPI-PUGE-AT-0042]|nr:guanine nucleotide binding protein, alpha subunit [Coprinopsis sp. MPI-PUGE-AT-0042]